MPLAPPGAIGYLLPEFPGQTHIWMWREISHLREWGVDLRLFATRRPDPDTAARHAFAAAARAETTYLWPISLWSAVVAVGWAAVTRPRSLVGAALAALTLDETPALRRAVSVALVVPACVLARVTHSAGIAHLHVYSAGRSAVIAMMTRRLTGLPYSLVLNAGPRVVGWRS